MTRTNNICISLGLLTAAFLLANRQFQQHRRVNLDIAAFEKQAPLFEQRLESQRKALAGLEKQNNELEETERRAGNQTLISLMRERNAVSMSSAPPAAKPQSIRDALA